ncbi:MAG: posphoenolpyruvate synthetase regulatory kinase/phosphorylase PpsR [Pseudomonadota bacterium]
MNDQPVRTVFFISDGTGITAETLGHSLLTQFGDLKFRQVRIPFVTTVKKAMDCVAEIQRAGQQDGLRPIVITTLVNPEIASALRQADALFVNFFETFIAPLEQELGMKSTHTIGRSHSAANSQDYFNRIDAINFAMAHDDGLSPEDLDMADVILVGVSRSGKTPTSLYLALQFGVKAANYPLIPDDFDRMRLPQGLDKYRHKLFGLTIAPERLQQIRTERRPNSRYASLENCRREVLMAEKLMRSEGIRWLDSTAKSIEEIAATIIEEIKLDRHVY